MTILVQQLRERASRATPGPWELQTSNSWRRIGTTGGRFADGDVLAPTTHRGDNHPDLAARQEDLDFIVAANPAAILVLLDKVEQLEKSLRLVQTHAGTAYNRGRQAGIADQERTAREAIAAMDLARDQMMDENERFTDLLEKAEQERDRLKAENAELKAQVGKSVGPLTLGIRGKAYGPLGTHRAYTYAEQPDNPGAWRLGEALVEAHAAPAGDHIDGGLGLLHALQLRGFGVFEMDQAMTKEQP
nr:ead/Ea22-like family protein [uncultured Pseudomonas sp.]